MLPDSHFPSSPAPMDAPTTLVIGLGNPLMADDGVGLAALARLTGRWRVPPAVELLDGGTWGLRLLPCIETAERLLLLDAVEAGAEPGTLVVLEREAIPRLFAQKISPHQIDLREVLALAELRGRPPAEVVAIGIQPGQVTMAPGLTPAVEAGLEAMVLAAVSRLRDWGHQLAPLDAPAAMGAPCTS